MCSGCRIPGTPAAAITIPARRVYSRPVGHAGVHDGDRRVRGRPLLRQQQRERPAEGHPATEDADLVTGDGDLVVREQRLDAGGRARHRARHHEREAAHVHRVQPVDVLVGIELEQRGLVVDLRRRRVLEQDAVDVGVVVQLVDRREHGRLVGVGGQVDVRRRCSRAPRPSPASCRCSGRSRRRRRRGACRGPGCGRSPGASRSAAPDRRRPPRRRVPRASTWLAPLRRLDRPPVHVPRFDPRRLRCAR